MKENIYLLRTSIMRKYSSIVIVSLVFLTASSCSNNKSQNLSIACSPDTLYKGVDEAWKSKFTNVFSNGIFHPGFTKSGWWVKTVLKNTGNENKIYRLSLNNPHINEVGVYINGDTIPRYTIGDKFRFNDRVVKDRDLVIPFEINANDSVRLLVWVDKKGESLQMKFELLELERFHETKVKEKIWMGVICGWFILIFFICIFIWLNSTDQLQLIYGLYVLSVMGWVIANWGIGYEYIWYNSPPFASKARPVFILAAMTFLSLAIVRFNPNPAVKKWMVRVHYTIIGTATLMIFLILFSNLETLSEHIKYAYLILLSSLIFFWIIFCFVMIVCIGREKFQPVRYFNIAISFSILSFVFVNLYHFGVDSNFQQFLNLYGSSMIMFGETSIIAFGLTKRYSHIMKEKEELAKKIIIKEKGISENLIRIQEEERSKIGRDIHDSLGSSLAALQIHIDKLQTDHPQMDYSLTKEIVAESIAETRNISHGLVSELVNKNGLESALRNQVELFQTIDNVQFMFYYNCSRIFSLPVSSMIFRICVELLNNAVKHSCANEISLQLTENEEDIQIIVEDNGIGLSKLQDSKGIGLSNIEFRVSYLNGKISMDSNKAGTTFIIEIPINSLNERSQ